MLYIGHLYQAWLTVRILRNSPQLFDFATYPKLGKMFCCIEMYLQEQSSQTSTPKRKREKQIVDRQIVQLGVAKKPGKSSTEVLDKIQSELDGLKSEIELATSSFLEKISKTVGDLEREKKDQFLAK
jgi:hypothetical protein